MVKFDEHTVLKHKQRAQIEIDQLGEAVKVTYERQANEHRQAEKNETDLSHLWRDGDDL